MVWGKKREPGNLPGRLRTREPLVPVKELGLSSLTMSFHADYWVLKVQGVMRYFVTNIKKKKLAKFISFAQKMLHFLNRFFQNGRELLTSSSDKLLHPSAHQALLNPPWPQCRMSHGTTCHLATCTAPAASSSSQRGRCEQPLHAQPAAEQVKFALRARWSHTIADNCIVPQPCSWAHPPQCCTQHICSFLLLVTAAPESLLGEPQGTWAERTYFLLPYLFLRGNL